MTIQFTKVIIDPDKKLIIEADQKTHELFNLEDKKLIGMTLQAFNKILSGFISSVPYVALKKSQGMCWFVRRSLKKTRSNFNLIEVFI